MINVLFELYEPLASIIMGFLLKCLSKDFSHFFIGLDMNNIETHSLCQLPLIDNQLFLIILIDLFLFL